MSLPFLTHVPVRLIVIGQEISWKTEMAFLFVVAIRFSCKIMCIITAKQHNCWFLILKRHFQNVAPGLALFTVVETRYFIGFIVNTLFISICWTKHISNSLLYCVVHPHFFLPIFGCFERDINDQLFVGEQVHFFNSQKACFVCLCRLYLLL